MSNFYRDMKGLQVFANDQDEYFYGMAMVAEARQRNRRLFWLFVRSELKRRRAAKAATLKEQTHA